MRAKKLISVVLSVCLVMCLFVPMFTASAAIDYPIIYIRGFGDPIYSDNAHPSSENQIYPTGADVGAIFSEALKPCLPPEQSQETMTNT